MINPQVKTFLTVCEKKSFTRAAVELYITPSAVLQQINALEKRLGVELVVRHRTGITLTAAGTYLEREGREWLRREEAVKTELLNISRSQNTISIGTSLLEKCRLLYELWMLYSDQEQEHQTNIHMVTLTRGEAIPPETDLIESINSEVPWMKEWDFFEICRMPFGFAIDKRHHLSTRKQLSLEDLKGETVVCFRNTVSQTLKQIFESMERGGIILEIYDAPLHSILQSTAFYHRILLAPLCWGDILVNMTVVPCQWTFTLPYGIFYRKEPTETVRRFLRFILKTYTEGNEQDVVPVFDTLFL